MSYFYGNDGNSHRRLHSDLNFLETDQNTQKKKKTLAPQPLPVFGLFMQCQILRFFKVLAPRGLLT